MTDQAITDTIVQELGRHRSHEEVARTICERFGVGWGDAEALVRQVALERRQSIAGRQSPVMIALILGGLIAGLGLISRFLLVYLAVGDRAVLSLGLLAQAGTGLLMVIGAIVGVFELARSLMR